MASTESSIIAARNEGIVSALCNHISDLSLDPKKISKEGFEEKEILSLFTGILQLTGGENSVKNKDEVMKWVKFANDFSCNDKTRESILKGFNEELATRSVLIGNGLSTSEADIIVYSALHSFVSCLSKSDFVQIPNVSRWMDYIQNTEDFGGAFEKIPVEKALFHPPASWSAILSNSDQNLKKSTKPSGETGKPAEPETKKSVKKKTPDDIKPTEEKNKAAKSGEERKKAVKKSSEGQKKTPAKKTVELNISALNIQVGLIRKAWKHPSADSLLVEEIELGDGNVRQVVSGLAKFCSTDDLTNRRVALITNVKPGKLRDVMSSGLVLCASNQDQTVVEPLLPPEKSTPGERISFLGYEGKPEDVLNPKKKQLEKITPDLYTDDKGVATYKGIPFMTSAGPCTSSISKGTIK
ncbi:hypothetical protein ZOSMA_48G00770 [Zostera marina]|uniref:Methionine--tRNA ligase n=1 Tax=Zostera marina TaxID=29655 RepID=A0A0K9NZC8_ZOSMR|nr:hypothetical protein ZOSMA_48G00770 [Zostera marina]